MLDEGGEMDANLTPEMVKFLLAAAAWPIAWVYEKYVRALPVRRDRWSASWKSYAEARNFERNPRSLEGEVSAVRIIIRPELLDCVQGPRGFACATAVITASRTSADEPSVAAALASLPPSTPEHARRALEELACPFELHATPTGVRVCLTMPTFADLDRAAEAVAQLARPHVPAAYR